MSVGVAYSLPGTWYDVLLYVGFLIVQIFFPRPVFFSRSNWNSDPSSHITNKKIRCSSGLVSSLLPGNCERHALYNFVSRKVQHLISSSTHVDIYD